MIGELCMCKKSKNIEEVSCIENKIIEYLKKGTSLKVKSLIEDVCNIKQSGDICITIDYNSMKITLSSCNPNSNIIGSDAVSAMVYVLYVLEELSNKGCIIIYQINKGKPICVGNENIKGISYEITNDMILKYLNKEIYVTPELKKYIDRGQMSIADYNNSKILENAQTTLHHSKINMWIAIVSCIITLVFNIYNAVCS